MLGNRTADQPFGEMAARIRDFDWAATSLGPMSSWPIQLKCAVDIILPSQAQIVMFCGPEFVALYNDSYSPTIGSKHPTALGRPAREGWSELWDDLEPLLRRVRETGQTVSAKDRPFYIERPEPETVYFDISYSPIRDDRAEVVAVMCIVNETTDRVGFESALRESEERLRLMIDQATVGVVQADLNGRLSFVNPGFCEIVGYAEQDLLGLTLQDLTHPDDLAENMEMVKRMGVDGKSFVIEKRYIRKDGKPVWVSNHVSPLKDRTGAVHEAVAIVVDISARRRALEAERRLAAIISSSEDAILAIDMDMRITDWNAGAELIYGFSAREAVGQPVAIIIPDGRVDEEWRIIERIKAGERVEPHDTIRRHKSGREVEVSLSVSPIYDPHGRIIGASKIARDISTRKEAERVQSVLIGELNHRVKNVLATVIAIARQTFGQASDVELANTTFEARLQSLARAHDLLTHGRWEDANLDRVIREALSPYPKERFDVRGPSIDISPKAVVAISLVIHELATNAAKYGSLSSTTGRVEVKWRISETDTPRLSLSWSETDGPSVNPPSHKGFGSRLIEGMISGQLNGHITLDYDPSGLRCYIEAPLDVAWTAEDLQQVNRK